ncbi:MAG: SDR family NAD(P)-dependent oxidoreductase [Alphaproteobacteria bacterium]|nr:SDR family NAD(P)-dependent oxidoreductase [Alphaproteobacteria bacterium]MCB9792772.1 SDR family NAD(P)-dependent oxidoreductase [Alphaproteobacteria bacterium]
MRFERAIVVGASSGMGAELVRRLAAQGTQVAALARREERLQALAAEHPGRVHAFACDVRDFDAAPALFDQIVETLGGLDLIIYASGVMPDIAESEYSWAKDHAILDVNLLGAVAWLNLAGAHFEAQRRGTLVGISSVAGDRGRRGNPVYTASKAGLSTYLEALRNRLNRYGVAVVTIKPGPVRTEMTEGMKLPMIIDAGPAAEAILKAAERGAVESYVPWQWGPIMSIIRAIPSFLFSRTNI